MSEICNAIAKIALILGTEINIQHYTFAEQNFESILKVKSL